MSNQNQIQVVIVPMDKKAYVKWIDESYESLSAIVDGNIGIIDAEFQVSGHHLNYIYCDSGKMDNYAPSRAIYIRDGKPGDIIFGDFIVTYINEEGNYISLTDDECELILKEMDAPARLPWPYILDIIQNKKV